MVTPSVAMGPSATRFSLLSQQTPSLALPVTIFPTVWALSQKQSLTLVFRMSRVCPLGVHSQTPPQPCPGIRHPCRAWGGFQLSAGICA